MKSPAFQFYPAEFLVDENVSLMSNQAIGCYIKLMCYCWREGSIPSDMPMIAKLCGENSQTMGKLWPQISKCFIKHEIEPSRFIHPRLEKERTKQAEHRKERADAGTKGAQKRWAKPYQKNSSAIKQPLAKNASLSSTSSSINNLANAGYLKDKTALAMEEVFGEDHEL